MKKLLCVSAAVWLSVLAVIATDLSASVDYVNSGECKRKACVGTVTNKCKPSTGGCSGVCVKCVSTNVGEICFTSPTTPTQCIVSNLPSTAISCGNKMDVTCAGAGCTCTGLVTPTATPCKVKRCISN